MGGTVEGSGDAPPTPTELAEAAPGSDHPSDVPHDLNMPPAYIFSPLPGHTFGVENIQWTTSEREREREK